MDTTRRQLLAAIPAVGVAVTTGYVQEQPETKPEQAWEHEGFKTKLSAFERPAYWKWLNDKGREGWSIAYIALWPNGEDAVMGLNRSSTDKENRVAWEMKWVEAGTHTRDWQVCAFLFKPGFQKFVVQRPVRG